MLSKYLWICWSVILFAQIVSKHVQCASIGVETDESLATKQGSPVIPDWVKQAIGDDPQIPSTTKATPPGGNLGQTIQGILQGIAKAPVDIANRVQGIIQGIIRRPSTAVPIVNGGVRPPAVAATRI